MDPDSLVGIESIAGRRPYQQDGVLHRPLGGARILVALADGMGGHAAGDVASALALDTLARAVEEGATIEDAFRSANAAVHEGGREPGQRGMGTTLVAALIEEPACTFANVGDSRGYLISPGGEEIRQVTEDHSYVAAAIARGVSPAQALASPWRHTLTRAIGTEPDVEVDVFGPFEPDPGSSILLCSDGLSNVLDDEDLLRIRAESDDPQAAAEALVRAAFEAGSDDNISVLVMNRPKAS